MEATPFLQSTVDLGHTFWKKLVTAGDVVVDATCGNGYDTLFLAELVLKDNSGAVIAIDIQKVAVENTKALLQKELSAEAISCVEILHECHSNIEKILHGRKAKLIVYNLGYLPGSDKSVKTDESTTMKSIMVALDSLEDNGSISITCYPGHAEGAIEEEKLLSFSQKLNPRLWRSLFCSFNNRTKAPSLLLIQKIPQQLPCHAGESAPTT